MRWPAKWRLSPTTCLPPCRTSSRGDCGRWPCCLTNAHPPCPMCPPMVSWAFRKWATAAGSGGGTCRHASPGRTKAQSGHPPCDAAARFHQEDERGRRHPDPHHPGAVPDPDPAGRGPLPRSGQGGQNAGRMSLHTPPPFTLHEPTTPRIPLVCDSPHSGTTYPADFKTVLPRLALRAAEDTHVEALWSAAPALGATLLEAHFPRSYLDLNRSLDDIEPALLDGPWHTPLSPGEKTRLGSGLIWRSVKGQPLYDRPLSVAEVQQRINRCYRPYHAALSDAVTQTQARFGAVWHLNLHSMPNNAYERLQIKSARPLADFVLGDRDGSTCEPAFVA